MTVSMLNKLQYFEASILGLAICFVGYTFIPIPTSPILPLVIFVVIGFGYSISSIAAGTQFYNYIPEKYHVRVSSIINMISGLCGVLSVALIGPVIDLFDLKKVLIAFGISSLIMLIIAHYTHGSRFLRKSQ